MITWGIGLMVVGGLSFVLPLFGRQFILVKALDLTGIGPFLGGIVLFGIGVALFVNARRPETTGLEVRLAKRAPPSRSVAESNGAKTSAVNPSGTHGVLTKKSDGLAGVSVPSKMTPAPFEYGLQAVKLAIDGAAKGVKTLIEASESKIQQAIAENSAQVQLHLIALQVAAYYVCAYKVCSADRDPLSEVGTGISAGFQALFGDDPRAAKDGGLSQFLYDLFQEYAPLLSKELDEFNDDDSFNMGMSAKLATIYIGKQCGINELLETNHLERLRIELLASSFGIKLLMHLRAGEYVSYGHVD